MFCLTFMWGYNWCWMGTEMSWGSLNGSGGHVTVLDQWKGVVWVSRPLLAGFTGGLGVDKEVGCVGNVGLGTTTVRCSWDLNKVTNAEKESVSFVIWGRYIIITSVITFVISISASASHKRVLLTEVRKESGIFHWYAYVKSSFLYITNADVLWTIVTTNSLRSSNYA